MKVALLQPWLPMVHSNFSKSIHDRQKDMKVFICLHLCVCVFSVHGYTKYGPHESLASELTQLVLKGNA